MRRSRRRGCAMSAGCDKICPKAAFRSHVLRVSTAYARRHLEFRSEGCGSACPFGRENRNKVKDLARASRSRQQIFWPVRSEKRRARGTVSSPISGVAERYASSLFELALDAKQVAKVECRSRPFPGAARRERRSEAPDRRARSFPPKSSSRPSTAIADKAGITGLVGNFLKVVARNRRLFARSRHDQGVPSHRCRASRRSFCRGHLGACADGSAGN